MTRFRAGFVVAALSAALIAAAGSRAAPFPAERVVAVTIDDLPYVGTPPSIERARRVGSAMTEALRSRSVPAEGFVTGSRVWVEGQVDDRLALLRRWRDAGVRLGGHGFHHLSFQTTPWNTYVDDVVAGLRIPQELMAEIGAAPRYYRHPFNHTGPTADDRDRFVEFMAARGIEVVPFTVEHADYLFSALWDDAEDADDRAALDRLEDAYLSHLDRAFDFAEQLAEETFGRPIAQVFLIHANGINGELLGTMLDRLRERGYRFVGLEEALADPAYATADEYVNRFGPSWLHRWRVALGLPNALRHEPDPPAWVLEAYQAR